MAYKLIITEKAEEHLDNHVHHLIYKLKNNQAAVHLLDSIGDNIPDRGNFCICNRYFPSVGELYKESVTAAGTESEK